MAIVVRTCAVIDLRLLGVGEGIPLRALHGAPPLVWPSIEKRGLLSTTALLDLFEVEADRREAIKSRRTIPCWRVACAAVCPLQTELTIDRSVPDFAEFVVRVEETGGPEPSRIVWP